MYFQVMTYAEAESLPYNPFDLTKVPIAPSQPLTFTASHLLLQTATILSQPLVPFRPKNTPLLLILHGHSRNLVPPYFIIGVVPLRFPPPRDRPHGPGQKPTELLR
jgi:hypothetical protein